MVSAASLVDVVGFVGVVCVIRDGVVGSSTSLVAVVGFVCVGLIV